MQEKDQIISQAPQETHHLAKKILACLEEESLNVLLLQGNLGGGKTTFCQGVLTSLGAEGPFTSPSFVIMKKYSLPATSHFKNVYHIDCYRVDEQALLDLGWKEIIANQENLVLVEWPEKIKAVWPKKYYLLEFELAGEHQRKIKFTKMDA